MIRIDKNRFSESERALYDSLIAKAAVDPEAAEDEMEEEDFPVVPPKKTKKAEVKEAEDTKKSADIEVPDFVKDAIAKSEEFMTRVEKQEMADVAKKYAVLGQNTEELAEKLYNLQKSDPDMYETCISVLDNQVDMIEKSGLFAEIGKSAAGYSTAGGAEAKAEAKANEIMKADPSMTYDEAIAKAWEDPDLMAEYDAEYGM